MAVISAPTAPTHAIDHARFTALATPSRGSAETSVWRVELASGAPATPHRLTREEVWVLLDGQADVSLDGQTSRANTGDAIVVPPGTEFAITAVGVEPLHAVCLPVGGQGQIGDGDPFAPDWVR